MFGTEIKRALVILRANADLPALCVGEFKFEVIDNKTIVRFE